MININSNIIGGQGASFDPTGSGIFKLLTQQSGNLSPNIKVKLGPTHVSAFSNWSSGTPYFKGDIRIWPQNSLIEWKCINDVTSVTSPDFDPSNWEIVVAFDMLQDSGDGKWFRTTLQRSTSSAEPDWIKLRGFQKGHIASTSYQYGNSTYDGFAPNSSSSTSITVPTPGNQVTLTIGSGLTLPNSSTIGSNNETFSIPSTDPTLMTRNLPTGLPLVAGDTITFTGDSTNFFVFVVARYNSLTGVCYGFSTMHTGSGSFSSWALKKERLIYVYRTADQNFCYFYGLLQSYNSGTGSMTLNGIKNVSTQTRSDWTVLPGMQPVIPTGLSAAFNDPNNAIGAFMTGSFAGTQLNHLSNKRNSGTGWAYIYTGGPLIASPPANVTIDTYNSSTITGQRTVVFDDLAVEALTANKHQFIAVSITSPNGSSSNALALIDANTAPSSFQNGYNYEYFAQESNYGFNGDGQSVGEFVLKYKDNNFLGDTLVTWPRHNDHTENNLTRQFYVDNVLIDGTAFNSISNPYLYKYHPFTEAKTNQTGTMINDFRAGNYSSYSSVQYLNKYGYRYTMFITWLKDVFLDQGYNNMNEDDQSWIVDVKAASGEVQVRPADGVRNEMTSTFKGQTSYLHRGSDTIAIGQYFPLPTTWRLGTLDNGGGHIETGSAGSYVKMRPFPSDLRVILAGTVEAFEGRWYLGNRGVL